jgi:hypothetical protein
LFGNVYCDLSLIGNGALLSLCDTGVDPAVLRRHLESGDTTNWNVLKGFGFWSVFVVRDDGEIFAQGEGRENE